MADGPDEKVPNRGGRPPIPIDEKVVEGMASVGATNAEIGDFCGCDGDTIGRRFTDILTKARADMRTKLRRAQMKTALAGNATMQIWLGKQMLGQKDLAHVEVSRSDIADLTDEELERIAAGIPISKVLGDRARA